MQKLTKQVVESAEIRTKEYWLHDGEMKKFFVRIMPSGSRIYTIRYVANGKRRVVAVGTHGIITLQQARQLATEMLASVYQGNDLFEEKKRKREEPFVKDLADRFMNEHAQVNCKPRTRKEYQRLVDRYIIPELGQYKVSTIERGDLASLHFKLNQKPCDANKCLAILSKMFNLAELWGLRTDGSNPCRHIGKFKENKRERYLNKEELQRLSQALIVAEQRSLISAYAIAAFRLLILTGARLSEIQLCKWEYVDLTQRIIKLPDSKTGAKFIHLGQLATETLQAIPRKKGNPFIICSEIIDAQPLNDLQKPWQKIRKLAELPDVRIHDLRHTFASQAVTMGVSLPMIGKLLGHTQPQTTARYAHLAVSPTVEAASLITNKIGEAFVISPYAA